MGSVNLWLSCGLAGILLLTAQGFGVSIAIGDTERPRTLQIDEAKITAQLDPELRALYGKALLKLRNRTGRDLSAIDLVLPAIPGAEFKVRVVWDRHEELPWRRLLRQEAAGEFHIQFPLTHSLRAGKGLTLGVTWEVQLSEASESAPALITPEKVRLRGSGWYPVAPNGGAAKRLHLTLKMPKTWVATVPPKAKKRRTGFLLAEYELSRSGDFAGQVIFEAHAPEKR